VKGDERQDRRQVREIHSLRPSTYLTTALGLLLESGASSLPVIDEVIITTIIILVIITLIMMMMIIMIMIMIRIMIIITVTTMMMMMISQLSPCHEQGKFNVTHPWAFV